MLRVIFHIPMIPLVICNKWQFYAFAKIIITFHSQVIMSIITICLSLISFILFLLIIIYNLILALLVHIVNLDYIDKVDSNFRIMHNSRFQLRITSMPKHIVHLPSYRWQLIKVGVFHITKIIILQIHPLNRFPITFKQRHPRCMLLRYSLQLVFIFDSQQMSA